jgi:hypothetical protein
MLRTLKPKRWVPYHSFVSFCRSENQYLNRYRVGLEEIAAFVEPRAEVQAMKLYPGDRLIDGERQPYPGGKEYFYSERPKVLTESTSPGDPIALTEAATLFEKSFEHTVSLFIRRKLRPLGFVVEEDGARLLFDPASSRFEIGVADLEAQHPEYSWTRTNRQTLTQAFKLPWGLGDLLISGRMRTQVPAEFRAADFRFWAVALIRHTGYFNLSSLWFLRPRAVGTGLRRWRESLDIVVRSVKGGGFLAGNIEPKRRADWAGGEPH